MSHILSWLIFLPTLGALGCLLAPKSMIKPIAGIASGLTLLLSLLLFPSFMGDGALFDRYGEMHHVERLTWIVGQSFTIEYFLGVDGISFPLLILTTLVSFLACLASWNFEHWTHNKGLRGYFVLFLLLETGMLGVFAALDFFLFYIFWEVMLLPMYFLIGVWGGARKEYAAIKFFLFTLAGSVLMLIALIAMFLYSAEAIKLAGGALASGYRDGVTLTQGSFDLLEYATNPTIQQYFNSATTFFLGYRFAPIMFALLYIGFAIKLPMFPFHTWLPDAHVEAPTPISMILAGVLLKMGGYGFLRLCYPIFPVGGLDWAHVLGVIGVISILYGALCAMAQTDFKKLVAYSSVSHMGYVLLGIAVMTQTGFQGAMFQMLAHGISSPMCFFLVGIIYDRAHHREINKFGGLWLTMPRYGSMATLGLAVMTETGFQGAMFQMIAHGISSPMCFFLVGVIYDRAHHREINRFGGLWLSMPKYGTMATIGFFASLGLPGLCGFIGELWVLLGTFEGRTMFPWATTLAILASSGVILTAGYILWLIQRVYLGKVRPEYADFPEATGRELFILAPLAALAIVLGILPMQTLFNFMNGTLSVMLDQVKAGFVG